MNIYLSYEEKNIAGANKVSEQVYERFNDKGIKLDEIINVFLPQHNLGRLEINVDFPVCDDSVAEILNGLAVRRFFK